MQKLAKAKHAIDSLPVAAKEERCELRSYYNALFIEAVAIQKQIITTLINQLGATKTFNKTGAEIFKIKGKYLD